MHINALIYGRCLELVGTSWNEKLLNCVHLLPPLQKPWFRIELILVQNNQLRRAGTTNQNRFPHHPLTQRHRAERPTGLRSARGRRETISRSLHHCRTSIKTPKSQKVFEIQHWLIKSSADLCFRGFAYVFWFDCLLHPCDGHPRTILVREYKGIIEKVLYKANLGFHCDCEVSRCC